MKNIKIKLIECNKSVNAVEDSINKWINDENLNIYIIGISESLLLGYEQVLIYYVDFKEEYLNEKEN